MSVISGSGDIVLDGNSNIVYEGYCDTDNMKDSCAATANNYFESRVCSTVPNYGTNCCKNTAPSCLGSSSQGAHIEKKYTSIGNSTKNLNSSIVNKGFCTISPNYSNKMICSISNLTCLCVVNNTEWSCN
jgi:hypothetical protein